MIVLRSLHCNSLIKQCKDVMSNREAAVQSRTLPKVLAFALAGLLGSQLSDNIVNMTSKFAFHGHT